MWAAAKRREGLWLWSTREEKKIEENRRVEERRPLRQKRGDSRVEWSQSIRVRGSNSNTSTIDKPSFGAGGECLWEMCHVGRRNTLLAVGSTEHRGAPPSVGLRTRGSSSASCSCSCYWRLEGWGCGWRAGRRVARHEEHGLRLRLPLRRRGNGQRHRSGKSDSVRVASGARRPRAIFASASESTN